MTIKLFDLPGAEPDPRFGPYCWRSKLALAHKGLAVEAIPWRFVEKEAIAGRAGCRSGRYPPLAVYESLYKVQSSCSEGRAEVLVAGATAAACYRQAFS
jgi:hypothetical protein